MLMPTTYRHAPDTLVFSLKETADIIRKRLDEAFPDLPRRFFSVRIGRYAWCATVNVGYDGGPSSADVHRVVGGYACQESDGMIDLSYSTDRWIDGDARILGVISEGSVSSGGVRPAVRDPQPPGARRAHFQCTSVYVSRGSEPGLE
jgi:hypothetical protein